jgi:hypothetical protein
MTERAKQIAVPVLGAGRSGTSAITRGLQALGVELGPNLRRGAYKNPTGFFEDEELLALNKRLKRLLGIRGTSVRLIEPQEWDDPRVRALRDEAVATVRQRFGSYPMWGYKYARTLRLLPFWLAVYDACELDVRYVVALRNPISVARSRARLDARRGTQEKSDLEWLVNVVPYFRHVRERPFVVTDFDLVMADPWRQLERIAAALDLPASEQTRTAMREYAQEFLVPGMRHSVFSAEELEEDRSVNPLTRSAYLWLRRLAADEIDSRDPVIWEEWVEIEQRLAQLAPVLRHVDRVEEDLYRARRNPLGPLQIAPEVWRKVRDR